MRADSTLAARERVDAGVTLARLGDPRVELLDPDEMQFCFVPSGEFWLGSGDADQMANDDEKVEGKPHCYALAYNYWMARLPVTNAQFKCLVKEVKNDEYWEEQPGYASDRYWTEAQEAGVWRDGGIRGPVDNAPRTRPYDYGAPFGLANHPVVGITWYEALAYTRWLTERWQRDGFIGMDQEVALPSEPEWEKAARGGLQIIQPDSQHARPRPARSGLPTRDVSEDQLAANAESQRPYPWGADPDTHKANYADTRIGATSAVGAFPGGASPYGCEEMSGNCWEWTRSLWGDYPYPKSPGDLTKREARNASRDQSRVLRGGGFDDNAWGLRCAYRSRNSPDDRSWLIGFRVVVRPLL